MAQNNCWNSYWNGLIKEKRLENYISEMDQADTQLQTDYHIEDICHRIYDDYQSDWRNHLEDVRANFLKLLDEFKYVHLQTSGVKSIDSLLEKVIIKRHKFLRDSDSSYAKISGKNYKDIVTDLIGIRIIVNYRGNWKDIDKEILNKFSYDKSAFQDDKAILPHSKNGENIVAQIPIVYYAQGDNVEEYKRYGMITKQHPMGYRSIHYTVSYQGIYVELQIRTIYDEAWSDCDHNYVYKMDRNRSHSALVKLSGILSKLTNISNDMGENMKEIFEKQSYTDIGDEMWTAEEYCVKEIDNELKRLYDIVNELDKFKARIQVKQRMENHERKNDE